MKGGGLAGGAVVVLAAAWSAGFLWFAQDARRTPPPPPHADAIVALTGGADRVATALTLLRAGRADRLLISGVHGNIDLPFLARGTGIDPASITNRVTIGRDATDTLGNAVETASWARAQGVHSLIVVTAGYHMRRALTEIRRDLPEVTLFPAPVVPPALRHGQLSGLRLLAEEYTKWLAARAGLTRMLG
jgi:uncharacterized SAM-binding protein YcdF (DUF218 family)